MDEGAPSVEVVVDPHRGPLLVKRATSAAGRGRLTHEAAVLAAAAPVPGVAELLAHHDAPEEARLVTRWVGPHTLATSGPLPVEQAAGVVAALAGTVAGLHAIGVVHARLTPDHVVLGPGGAPVLCGFGEAGEPGRCAPAEDVAALGRLLTDLVASAGVDVEPIPEGYRRFGRRRWAGYHRRTLLILADQATADDHTARPTAHGLAEAIATAVPDAVLPPAPPRPPSPGPAPEPPPAPRPEAVPVRRTHGRAEPARTGDTSRHEVGPRPHAPRPSAGTLPPSPPPRAPRRPGHPDRRPATGDRLPRRLHRAVPVLAAVVGMALVLAGFREVVSEPETAPPAVDDEAIPPIPAPASPRSADGPATTHPPATTRPPTTRPSTTPPPQTRPPKVTRPAPRPGCPAVAAPAADADGDGCPETIVVEGDRVVAAGVTYQVGRPGDLVSVGDWDCDGRATPALLRTATGEVFVFDRWATPGHDLTVRPVTVVGRATAVAAQDRDGDGCPELTVRRSGGADAVISVGGA